MYAWTAPRLSPNPPLNLHHNRRPASVTDPSPRAILAGLSIAIFLVILTRLPLAREGPLEWDEFGYLEQTTLHWFPMHHTLFMTFGRLAGLVAGTPYRGFIWLDMVCSAAALVGAWWWLRAIVPPVVAAAAAAVLGAGPVFWGYGAIAGNYTAIVLVGSVLLGIAYRGFSRRVPWHPAAAALVLAFGNGYRSDLGTLWLPVFAVILWQHRWKRASWACCLFAILNLAWFLPMLHDVGGWARYRSASSEFAYQAGYLSSVWNLGLIDSPARNAVKLAMALVWTLGPALIFVPRGALALRRLEHGTALGVLMLVSIVPALASHLLVQFGVQGWCFHYVPAILGLVALGAAGVNNAALREPEAAGRSAAHPELIAAGWLGVVTSVLAGVFCFYPTDYEAPGLRGSFDLAFSRFTRIGLRTPLPDHGPRYWRTANSRPAAGTAGLRPGGSRVGDG